MTSKSTSGETSYLRTSENPSPMASMAQPSTRLLASLIAVAPSGRSPAWKVCRPIAAKSGSHVRVASGGPAATMPSSPAAATSGRPSTGAATRVWPTSACAGASAWIVATPCVPMATWVPPAGRDSRIPPSPSVTSSRTASSATIVTTTSRPSHASATDAARRAPASTRSPAFSAVRFQTTRSWPAATSCPAIPRPIRPRPMKPTCIPREHSRRPVVTSRRPS